LANDTGGAIMLDSEARHRFYLEDSSFFNNSASYARAVYSSNISLNLTKCTFEKNYAELDGGALEVTCPKFKDCQSYLTQSAFRLNVAGRNGGGIKWNHAMPQISNNSFQNNSAAYGPDVASYPVSLVLLDQNETEATNKVAQETSFAPGQITEKPIKIAFVDHYQNIVTTDNSSQASIQTLTKNC